MAIELLAAAAITMISPYLVKAGEAAAEKVGEGAAAAAGKVLGWIRSRLGGDAKAALEGVEANPGSEARKAVLKEELVRALEADPELAKELRALIPDDLIDGGAMTQDVSGAGAIGNQVKGSGNTVNINRSPN